MSLGCGTLTWHCAERVVSNRIVLRSTGMKGMPAIRLRCDRRATAPGGPQARLRAAGAWRAATPARSPACAASPARRRQWARPVLRWARRATTRCGVEAADERGQGAAPVRPTVPARLLRGGCPGRRAGRARPTLGLPIRAHARGCRRRHRLGPTAGCRAGCPGKDRCVGSARREAVIGWCPRAAPAHLRPRPSASICPRRWGRSRRYVLRAPGSGRRTAGRPRDCPGSARIPGAG